MSHTLGEIAEVIGAQLHGDPTRPVRGVASLTGAERDEISFLGNPRFHRYLKDTRAAAVILGDQDLPHCPVPALVCPDPYVGYVRAARYLNPAARFVGGVDPRAVVSPSASLGKNTWIGPTAVVEARARLGENVFVGPGCVIGEDAVIGPDSRLVANVTLCAGVVVGSRVVVHPGAVIGADGFGLAREGDQWLKIPQLGRVIIHDDVEIGAGTAVDRGALEDTVIEEGVKIDNLVQIGHNTRIGAHTAIAGCAVIAGSVRIGRRCMIGGASAIAGHIEIADDVVITGMSGVSSAIREAGTYSGSVPLAENRAWRRNMVRLRHLDELAERLAAIEAEVRRLKDDPDLPE